jgi:hypothetical protein
LLDPRGDVVACGAHLVDRPAFRVGELPVDVALAGDVRARVAAAHRDHDVGLLGKLAREPLRAAVREVDAQLAHDLDDLGVNLPVRVGFAAGRQRVVSALRGAVEQGGAHLRAPGIVQTDKQGSGHQRATASSGAGPHAGPRLFITPPESRMLVTGPDPPTVRKTAPQRDPRAEENAKRSYQQPLVRQ